MKTFICFMILAVSFSLAHAEEKNKITTIELHHINGEEVMSVIKSLVSDSVAISVENNALIINGNEEKTKVIREIISQIDTPPTPLTIEFIASNRVIDFKNPANTYESDKNRNKTSQSMSITERQWVTLNTGLSIPIAQRKRLPDGTETQSFHFEKISKSYVFKVHEFSGWSVIQVGVNSSSLSEDVAGAIKHTQLDTTIVGKTGEWLEVASSKKIASDKNSETYTTNRSNDHYIHLYVKVENKAKKAANEQ